ncbi:DNA-protecting protein DprA [Testudinibacter sp. TR-2022]|uniref:DNA-processing protein DprA n=1 Tax=Testudinibacter sp. TR-2022 TaxID=2585029 RepID=UPI00111B23E6|nr:DNA-processing protein DprA [Testudinibacter sp. TR-2022]TNH03139.1 DNA-protecting protein DprA [Pasteurellaceae bacterium Phil31]TNH10861.1 DNA-protecting protein DprA [Testudinibacter sp. TR-2022]TNH12232.1 DNA-protecting protein DprA [Testudinibacter sp. TR-2022]TNH15348.1 DNA-protecting protein DprA [Testudinibacter sp. TR-2022]TNH17310.1 DNA-protecting protein DprA [Testudinibacter sp. TR-2022]
MSLNIPLELLLRLNQIPNFGSSAVLRLLKRVSAQQLLEYGAVEWAHLGLDSRQIQRWLQPKKQYIDPVLAWQAQSAVNQVITIFDADYPFLLKQIASAPLILYLQGDRNLLQRRQIAMVGSRDCSDYGEYWSRYFAAQLSLQGYVITSGMALGIDSYSHRAALESGGKTIAVLGSGLNRIYPKRNQSLAQQIIEQGALVSEFIPNQAPLAENFPRRNRIISGLSLGTLVVEADVKSGSLITARYALEQNREVFALPGAVQNRFSRGCHSLIKQGALLVESYQDILENLSAYPSQSEMLTPIHPVVPDTAKMKPLLIQPVQQTAESDKSAVAYPELYRHIGYQAISADDLATALNLPISEVLSQLLELELEGAICTVSGGYCRC